MAAPDPFTPVVDDAVWRLRPDYVGLSVVVRGGRNAPGSASQGDPGAAGRVPAAPAWAEAHLTSWREAYQAFGARAQRTPCSAEALRRRVERDGVLPRINAVVDAYNALSLEYAVPIGGEDLSAYAGPPRLVRAEGREPFETVRDGKPHVEAAEPGEVIWRDDLGVTCRRWNWRQTVRTRLEIGSTDMWFVLERLDPMPVTAVMEAGDRLADALRRLAPDAQVATTLLQRPGSPTASQDVRVRLADTADDGRVAAVLGEAFESFRPLYTAEAYAATTPEAPDVRRRMGEGPVWIAELGGGAVGTISAVSREDGVYVRGMAVLPSSRGTGVGRALLAVLEDFARAEGAARLYLSTTPFLTAAIRLYEAAGFVRTDAPPHDLRGTPLFTMEKVLR